MSQFKRGDLVVIARDFRAKINGFSSGGYGYRGMKGVVTEGSNGNKDWLRVKFDSWYEFEVPTQDLDHVAESRPKLYVEWGEGLIEVDTSRHVYNRPTAVLVEQLRSEGQFLKLAYAGYGSNRRYWLAIPTGTTVVWEEI